MQPTRKRKSSSRQSIVVTEIDLRALFMKVIQCQRFRYSRYRLVSSPCSSGFLERRGMSAIGSHVAFIGDLDTVSNPVILFNIYLDNSYLPGSRQVCRCMSSSRGGRARDRALT